MKTKNDLAKYLANYIEYEFDNAKDDDCFLGDELIPDRPLLAAWLAEGIEAFESTEDLSIIIQDK